MATNKEEYDVKIEELNAKLGETEASIEVGSSLRLLSFQLCVVLFLNFSVR